MEQKIKWSLGSLGRAWQLVRGKDAECVFRSNSQFMAPHSDQYPLRPVGPRVFRAVHESETLYSPLRMISSHIVTFACVGLVTVVCFMRLRILNGNWLAAKMPSVHFLGHETPCHPHWDHPRYGLSGAGDSTPCMNRKRWILRFASSPATSLQFRVLEWCLSLGSSWLPQRHDLKPTAPVTSRCRGIQGYDVHFAASVRGGKQGRRDSRRQILRTPEISRQEPHAITLRGATPRRIAYGEIHSQPVDHWKPQG